MTNNTVADATSRPVEIITRSDAELRDVDFEKRLVTVIAVPWEQEARVFWRGEFWTEVFTRGAFDGLEKSAGRVRANREHIRGNTVGRVVQADPEDPQGLITTVLIAETPLGDETLALAKDDMISASIGYEIKRASDVELFRKKMLRRVNRAFLNHLSFVEAPAFEGARVLAVREDPSGLAVAEVPLPETPNLDELANDELLKWARSRTSSG
jgi:HK97 family phage prohead protease